MTLYYGSSVFDSAQMSRLIDILIQDAEAQGIPTITEEEKDRMLLRREHTKHKYNKETKHFEKVCDLDEKEGGV